MVYKLMEGGLLLKRRLFKSIGMVSLLITGSDRKLTKVVLYYQPKE
jgi:hypothetical protein